MDDELSAMAVGGMVSVANGLTAVVLFVVMALLRRDSIAMMTKWSLPAAVFDYIRGQATACVYVSLVSTLVVFFPQIMRLLIIAGAYWFAPVISIGVFLAGRDQERRGVHPFQRDAKGAL